MKLTEQHPDKRGAIVVTNVACACNDAGCPECVARANAAVRFALTTNMTADNAAAMTAILDGRGYDDPSRPMSRGDFHKAMQEIADRTQSSAAAQKAVIDAATRYEAEIAKRDAELIALRAQNDDLAHANAMHASTLAMITDAHATTPEAAQVAAEHAAAVATEHAHDPDVK